MHRSNRAPLLYSWIIFFSCIQSSGSIKPTHLKEKNILKTNILPITKKIISYRINAVIDHRHAQCGTPRFHFWSRKPLIKVWFVQINRPYSKGSVESADGINPSANEGEPGSASAGRHLGQRAPPLIFKIITFYSAYGLRTLATNN